MNKKVVYTILFPMLYTTFQERGYCSPAGYDRIDAMLRDLCRLYNAALEERREAYRRQGKPVTLYEQMRELTGIRKDDPEGFGKQHIGFARGALNRLDRAFNAFFRRVKAGEKPGFPRFKPWQRFQCIDVANPKPGMVKRKGRKVVVKMKGLTPIKLRPSRTLPDSTHLKSLRIVRRPTGVTVDLVYDVHNTPLPETPAAVGIDMGVRKRMTLSSGEVVTMNQVGYARPPRRKAESREAREAPKEALHARAEGTATDWDAIAEQQRKIAACKRGSNNRRKAVKQLRRLRRHGVVRNRNACHRITTDLVRRNGMIAVEKLRIQNMTRSAAGTVEEPGKNVAAKSGLNRNISEQTWGLLRSQLAYKAAWAGRRFVEVDPHYTSRDCSRCGARHNPGKSERYDCPVCGVSIDRDFNAAVNILRAGILALAERQNGMRGGLGSPCM